MTSFSLRHIEIRGTRRHLLRELTDGLGRQLTARRQDVEFDRALEDAGPTMQNELLAVREELRRS